MARIAGVLDGIMNCTQCGNPMVKIGEEYRCMDKVDPEELVAVGFLPVKEASGKLVFEAAKDQQHLQATQAWTSSVEVDNAYLEKMGLNLEKIREYQLKHQRVP